MPPRDLERLAKIVKARRLELFPSRLHAAQKAGVSKDTWQRVEEGEQVRSVSYAKLDKALSWAVGSCTVIAEGGEPVPVVDTGGGLMASVPLEALEEDIRQSVTNATIATAPDLTAREITALNARVMDELRKRGILPPAGE